MNHKLEVMEYHVPVLLEESVAGLNIDPDGVYLDLTFGGGGHSREILKRLSEGCLIGFVMILMHWKMCRKMIGLFRKS